MTDLKSMTLEEITAALRAMGEPSFRGKQVFTWLHRGITDFDEMMNIPASCAKSSGRSTTSPCRRSRASRCRSSTGRSNTSGAVRRQLHRNGGHAVPPRKHRLCFLAGGLPDGLRFLRVYHCWQGERLNTV